MEIKLDLFICFRSIKVDFYFILFSCVQIKWPLKQRFSTGTLQTKVSEILPTMPFRSMATVAIKFFFNIEFLNNENLCVVSV